MDSYRYQTFRTLLLFLADLLAGLLALVGTYVVRFHVLPVPLGYDPADYARLLPVAMLMWMVARFWAGLHRTRQRAWSGRIFRRIIKCNILAVFLIMSAAFYTHIDYSRQFPPLLLLVGIGIMGTLRFAADRILVILLQRRGWGTERVAIVGLSAAGRLTARRLLDQKVREHLPVGFILSDEAPLPAADDQRLAGLPVLGRMAQLYDILDEHGLTEVFLADPTMEPEETMRFLVECEKRMIRARVVPSVMESLLAEIHLDEIAGLPLLGLPESRLRHGNLLLKRVFDILVSSAMLVALSPLMLLIALLVRLSSKGPILYQQERIGLDGATFGMLKFRSMRPDAEAAGPGWTTKDDPRVTSIGRILRRTNLDELPQLINVLRGEMSLVGPRPERPFYVDKFKGEIPRYMARHRVKAGMTGWAQVNGLRGDCSIAERLVYDLHYLRHWSIWLDVKILIMTLRAHRNAY